jgi:hypothetical protein
VSQRIVHVTIAEADERGTENDTSDDTFALVAWGLATDLSLTPNATVRNLRMAFRIGSALSRVRLDATRRPDLPETVVGLPGVNAGGDVLLFDAFPSAPEFLVPSRSDLPDAKLWSVATAQDGEVRLRAFVRGIDLPEVGQSARIPSGTLRPAPALTLGEDGRVAIAGAAGLVQVRAFGAGELLGEAVVLSGAQDIFVPGGDSAESITASVYEASYDPAEMSLRTVRERAASLAERAIAP